MIPIDRGEGGGEGIPNKSEPEAVGGNFSGGVFAEGADAGIQGGAAMGRQRALCLCGVGGTRRSDVSSAGEGDGEIVSAGI